MRIESLEKWTEVAGKLSAHGCRRYVTQFDVDQPEGFHAWFWCPDYPDVEIITHSQAVHDAIMRYPSNL